MSAQPKRRGRPPQSLPNVEIPNTFAQWIAAQEMDSNQVARLLGVTNSVVYGWRKGTRTPGLQTAIRIEEVSCGAVPVTSWKK